MIKDGQGTHVSDIVLLPNLSSDEQTSLARQWVQAAASAFA